MDVPSQLFREELQNRKQKLAVAVHHSGDQSLLSLLNAVDSALERLDVGSFGLCDVCHEPIENDRLLADPLVCRCLDHLTTIERQRLQSDLELAAQVQRTLLPPATTVSNGWRAVYHYQPLSFASGDYCDVIARGPDLYFLLGDVSGKGVAASMLVANLHGLFRTMLPDGPGVASAIKRANGIFCESTMTSQYATLICGKAGPGGTIELSNAGHCAPYVLRKSGEVTAFDSTGLPLGVFCDSAYSSICLQLDVGDSLFLYSDGLSECRNPEGLEYGESHLLQFLQRNASGSTEALVTACVEDLARFRRQSQLADDMSLMLIRRNA